MSFHELLRSYRRLGASTLAYFYLIHAICLAEPSDCKTVLRKSRQKILVTPTHHSNYRNKTFIEEDEEDNFYVKLQN